MPKVLIIVNSIKWLLTIREELVDDLISSGHTLSVIGKFDADEIKMRKKNVMYYNTVIERRGTNLFKDLLLIHSYKKYLEMISPDIVLTFSIKANIYGAIVARYFRVPSIVTITGLGSGLQNKSCLSNLLIRLYRVALKKTECVFFQNKANLAYMIENRVISEGKKVRVVCGSGVNLHRFKVLEYPNNSSNIRFLFIGRIMKEKGVGELIRAFNSVNSKYLNTSLELLGSYEDEYLDVKKEAVNNNSILYHGEVNDVVPYIGSCHCVILPTYHEGMANVLLEAAASGRPVIASRIPGCQETFVEEVSGLGCEPRDVDSLVRAMEMFINLPHEKKWQMGINGRIKMEREFDRQVVNSAYLQEINDSIQERKDV